MFHDIKSKISKKASDASYWAAENPRKFNGIVAVVTLPIAMLTAHEAMSAEMDRRQRRLNDNEA